jgi:type III pantothenate kinase
MKEFLSNIVADIGNTRIKWGRCEQGKVVEAISLPPEDFEAWYEQRTKWQSKLPHRCSWTIAGVQPAWRDTLIQWVESQGESVRKIDTFKQLNVTLAVDNPNRVGLDRLFNALAAREEFPNRPAIIVDAGTAITVDLVDDKGVFQGGSILPGLGLMSKALNAYTALLPLVEIPDHPEELPLPGKNTAQAIQTGIYWQAVGGVAYICDRMNRLTNKEAVVIITGGNGLKLNAGLKISTQVRPFLTLEGIRMTAEKHS